jgi:hypothetical protein
MVGAFISLRRSATLLRLKELSEYVPFQMQGLPNVVSTEKIIPKKFRIK